MIEVILKAFVTLVLVGAGYLVWATPLDVSAVKAMVPPSLKRPLKEWKSRFPLRDQLAISNTRPAASKDQHAIYQGDTIVARTKGDMVRGKNGLVVFPQIYDVQDLDLASTFEYRGKTFKALGPPRTAAGLSADLRPHLIEKLPCKELH